MCLVLMANPIFFYKYRFRHRSATGTTGTKSIDTGIEKPPNDTQPYKFNRKQWEIEVGVYDIYIVCDNIIIAV